MECFLENLCELKNNLNGFFVEPNFCFVQLHVVNGTLRHALSHLSLKIIPSELKRRAFLRPRKCFKILHCCLELGAVPESGDEMLFGSLAVVAFLMVLVCGFWSSNLSARCWCRIPGLLRSISWCWYAEVNTVYTRAIRPGNIMLWWATPFVSQWRGRREVSFLLRKVTSNSGDLLDGGTSVVSSNECWLQEAYTSLVTLRRVCVEEVHSFNEILCPRNDRHHFHLPEV